MNTIQQSELRRLWAARLVSCCSVSALSLFAVHMPGGYFGAQDELTVFGLAYTIWLLAAGSILAAAWLAGYRWAPNGSLVFLCINLGVFIPPLANDAVVGGAAALWSLILLSATIPSGRFAPVVSTEQPTDGPASHFDAWVALNHRSFRHLLLVAIGLTVSVVGFRTGSWYHAVAVCLAMDAVVFFLAAKFVLLCIRSGSKTPFLAGPPLVLALLTFRQPAAALSWIGVFFLLVLFMLMARSAAGEDVIRHFFQRPALLLTASFALSIAVGTLFLSFPAASTTGRSIAPIDALFTATSASCVTGLVVLDTPGQFTTFGHAVLLCLMQFGGLNIMVLSAFAVLLLGRRLSLRGEAAFSQILDLPLARSAQRIAVFIVSVTLCIEAAGAVALVFCYLRKGYGYADSLWYGAFHAVSAFCNAGFSLHSDSLAGFRQDPLALLTYCVLIMLGGIGFLVLGAAWAWARGQRERFLSVQVRLVCWATAILVLTGTAWFAAVEWNRSLGGLGVLDKCVNALLQSVTLRTAGFNSIELDLIHPAVVFLMLIYMFIGAAPGGTGGGVKVTTVAVLLGAIPTITRGRPRIVFFGRTIPYETVYRSAAIVVIACTVATAGTVLILLTHPITLQDCLFEVLSALGTVGLSLGATSHLNSLGKIVIIALMFIGRVGPLTLALLLGRASPTRVTYPDARIMVG
jgi:trk system potassium uptake protein TrkH